MGGEGGSRVALPAGSLLLNGMYEVQAQLGHGGFGIVYKALHRDLGFLVAIKEYFPAELSVREAGTVHPSSQAREEDFAEGLRRFLGEAKRLTEFKDVPNVVTCRDFFRENGTAYLVMDCEEGMSLADLLARRERAGRPFGEADLLAVTVPLLGGLKAVHDAGVLHRDIKPSNILIRREVDREENRPVLIDFGAAKQTLAGMSRSYAPYTEGFAAIEQVGEGKLGPWTDLYAVGAVMWRMVAGGADEAVSRQPVKVESRLTAFARGQEDPLPPAREVGAGRFPEGILAAIDRCIALREADRVQDCAELAGLLEGPGRVAEEPSVQPPRRPRSTARWAVALGAAAVAAALLAAVVIGVPEGGSPGDIEDEGGRAPVSDSRSAGPGPGPDGRDNAGGVATADTPPQETDSAGATTESSEPEGSKKAENGASPAMPEAAPKPRPPSATVVSPPPSDDRPAGKAQETIEPPNQSGPSNSPPAESTALDEWKSMEDSDSEDEVEEFIREWQGREDARVLLPLAEALLGRLRNERLARELAEEAGDAWAFVERSRNSKAAEAFIEKYDGVAGAEGLLEQARVLLGELRPRPEAGNRLRDCDGCPEMVVVDGGSFMMGSPAYENDREDDEGPRRRVTISGPLAVGVYEVTKEQYGRFVDDAGHDSGSACWTYESGEWGARTGRSWTNPGFRQGRQEPVVCVSWHDAQAYVKWLSAKTGEKYRLPTEAEWEYVARAASETSFSYGDDPDYTRTCGYGNLGDQVGADHYRWAGGAPCRDGYVHTAPVGSFSGNAFGLHDVHGNVWEWVQDWYGSYPSGAATDPRGPATGSGRVGRGGGWGSHPLSGRSAGRSGNSPGGRYSDLGFRVLRTIP